MLIQPVILSGGSGTRLWPLSRELYPKQLLALLGGDETLLQQTVRRLEGLTKLGDPLVVCNEEHRFLVAEQLRALGKRAAAILLEPTGRNTAPALTLAALWLKAKSCDDVMLVMPADHVIKDAAAFRSAVEQGAGLAANGGLVTFGIVPTGPMTGYGYIEKGQNHQVAAFVEKPDIENAKAYVDSGRYLWNSGMFMMRPSVWMAELSERESEILQSCERAFTGGRADSDFFRVDAGEFTKCKSDSIDYAVMEKTKDAVYVPLDAGWSDVGAWSALWDLCDRDADGNVVRGDVYTHATENALLLAQHRMLAAVGVRDIIAVETPDAVLIAHKEAAQHVKEIVKKLQAGKRSEYQIHRRVYRPWGYYEGIDAGERFQVKRLQVKPGASLSLQLHHHRAEHWVVVRGTAKVTRGDEEFILSENQSTYIPIGTKHRLENPGNIPLDIIEVQSGAYLGEDDIVRFEDKYNRHKN